MIDKNKAYRFRGDSRSWEFLHATGISQDWWCNGHSINADAFEYLYECGILLEYPELPGEDWEFCEPIESHRWWSDDAERWYSVTKADPGPGIYCRKKKPVITEVECVVETYLSVGDRIDRIDLPEGFAEPGDRVKVTKL